MGQGQSLLSFDPGVKGEVNVVGDQRHLVSIALQK